jgi:hypothetical protein
MIEQGCPCGHAPSHLTPLQALSLTTIHSFINNADIWTVKFAQNGILCTHSNVGTAFKQLEEFCCSNAVKQVCLCDRMDIPAQSSLLP